MVSMHIYRMATMNKFMYAFQIGLGDAHGYKNMAQQSDLKQDEEHKECTTPRTPIAAFLRFRLPHDRTCCEQHARQHVFSHSVKWH